jgi:dihydroxyacetone kinase
LVGDGRIGYTGDRLNFGLAAEMARAESIPVEIVVVADDVALRDTVPADRRRGIAGTVLVHKLAGAAAAEGLPLQEVAAVARAAAAKVGSMGVSLGACTLPSVGKPNFELGANEIEVGLGIHGEHGVLKMDMIPADDLVKLVIDTLLVDGKIKRGDRIALLINGLGSTPPLELAILARAALRCFSEEGIKPVRAWAGTFLSALDMPGFSLSVLPVMSNELELLDRPTTALAWPGGGIIIAKTFQASAAAHVERSVGNAVVTTVSESGRQLRELFARAAKALIDAEHELARLDGISGDGDLGASMRRGAEALLLLPEAAFATPAQAMIEAGEQIRKAIAGSSGPFYATAFLRAGRRLSGLPSPSDKDIAAAFSDAVQAVMDLGGAEPGDRTMIDALEPASRTFTEVVANGGSMIAAWSQALKAGEEGMERTSSMYPRLGRASYLGERAIGSPDAGAAAVVCWLKSLRDS